MANPEGTDGKENEYFKIFNRGANVDLKGYQVCNITGDCFVLEGTLLSNSCLKIFRKDFIFTLHNDKEELTLSDAEKVVLNKVTVPAAPSGKVWYCRENSCSFEDPQESCLLEADDVSTDPLNENRDDSELAPEEVDQATESTTEEVAKETTQKESSNFVISDEKDWEKAFKKIKDGQLVSLMVDIQGKVIIPKEVFSAKILYLSAFGKLVKISVYASSLTDMPFSKDETIEIKNGFLKYQSQGFTIGIGKKTEVKKINASSSRKKIPYFSAKKAEKMAGKLVKATGEILEKKGDYLFLKSAEDGANLSVYFPKPLFMKYQGTKNGGSLFPVFYEEKSKSSDFVGDFVALKGVCDFNSGSSRIILRDLDEIKITKKEKTALPQEANTNLSQSQKNVVAPSNLSETIPPPQENQAISPPPKTTLPETAQKISFRTLWQLFTWKIRDGIGGLF